MIWMWRARIALARSCVVLGKALCLASIRLRLFTVACPSRLPAGGGRYRLLINNEHPVKRTLTDNEQKCKSSVCIDVNFLFMYPLTSNKQAIKNPA